MFVVDSLVDSLVGDFDPHRHRIASHRGVTLSRRLESESESVRQTILRTGARRLLRRVASLRSECEVNLSVSSARLTHTNLLISLSLSPNIRDRSATRRAAWSKHV